MQEIMLVNPSRRGARKRRHGRKARRRNPHRARRYARSKRYSNPHRARRHVMRRRRRNPLRLGGMKSFLMPAVWGGTGAIVTDVAYRLLPVPGALAILKGGLAPVTKIAVAFGTAQLARMFLGATTAKEMLNGSLAVIAYGLLNDLVLSRIPVLSAPSPAAVSGYELNALGYNSPGQVVVGSGNLSEYISGTGMGEYISGYELSGA